MEQLALQDHYGDEFAHCYGCGRLNDDGMQLKSYWDGEETVLHFTADPKFSGGVPGNVYGGLIASLMDCHGAATASAAKARQENKPMSRFVTASLKVDFQAPTPTGVVLEIRGKVKEIKGRKVLVDMTLAAGGTICAVGSVVMVQIPSEYVKG